MGCVTLYKIVHIVSFTQRFKLLEVGGGPHQQRAVVSRQVLLADLHQTPEGLLPRSQEVRWHIK